MDELQIDPEEVPVAHSHLGFPVVGVGASAGCVEALNKLFAHLPAHSGMAFVVVVHLSPTHESALDAVIQASTQMPVVFVKGATPVEADHVYVISPSMRLTMNDGFLLVDPMVRNGTPNTAVDHFFRSLAEAHRERAIGIVMSGAGSDGTQGLKRLKETGGVVIAQRPDDAEFDSMPRSAIATGLVDLVLAAAEMPAELVRLWDNARSLELPSPPADLQVRFSPPDAAYLAEEALVSIKALLRERTGHDFAHYKRATVLRRLERRMQVTRASSLPQYRSLLESDGNETAALLQDMLISVTNFFRDSLAFEALETELRARISTHPPGESFRAWVAGCATGEEAYSIAILLNEVMGPHSKTRIQVFASDIDQRAIDIARAGSYAPSIVTDVSAQRLKHYFSVDAQGYRIDKSIRDSVLFSMHNVLRDPPFTRVDLICCRNLLIYLDREAQAQLLRTFNFALNPNGLLLLGNSETADTDSLLFTPVDKRQRLYRAEPVASHNRLTTTDIPRVKLAPVAVHPALALIARKPLDVLHEQVAALHAPPTVLIDTEHTILHVGERASPLLRFVSGPPSNKLLDLVRPEMRVALATALFRATETGKSVEARAVRAAADDANLFVNISVRPISDQGVITMFLVVFDETELSLIEPSDPRTEPDPVLLALDAELQLLKEQLKTSAGESAVSTEELRASNEEFHTVNEELRAAGEELEGSREELESVNEELTTVNLELRAKVDETSKAHEDVRNLIAATDIATVFLDRMMQIRLYTPQAASLFNLIAADIGRALLDITHRLNYDQLAHDVEGVLKTLQTVEREVSSVDGRWFLARMVPYRTAEDRIDGVILNFIDITTRRQVQARLAFSEQQMRLVAESMRDYAILTLDLDGVITSWNPGAERLFGWPSREAIGKPYSILYTDVDLAKGAHTTELAMARETGRASDDRWHIRNDGRAVFCNGVLTSLVDGKLYGYAKIARDFTANKVMEAQLDEAMQSEKRVRERLEKAMATKDEFMAVMSHELKNPLSLIQVSADLLLRNPKFKDEPAVIRAGSNIRQAVTSQAQIIDDLLDLSRLNTGKLTLFPVRMNLTAVVARVGAAALIDAERKGQTLVLELEPDLLIDADPVRIEQIVWNLLTNAVKFTPREGHITLSLKTEAERVRMDVTDSGIGMAQAQLEAVFEMFHQDMTGPARGRGGLGIGLALVKRLTELQGGEVQARSRGPQLGSTFTVWLPCNSSQPALVSIQHGAADLSGLRILLVDDSGSTFGAFAELLQLVGVDTAVVDGAGAAVVLLASERFDVVIAEPEDWLGDAGGFCTRVREASSAHLPVLVAVTAMSRPEDRLRALEAGYDAHLAKPMSLEQLSAQLPSRRGVPSGA